MEAVHPRLLQEVEVAGCWRGRSLHSSSRSGNHSRAGHHRTTEDHRQVLKRPNLVQGVEERERRELIRSEVVPDGCQGVRGQSLRPHSFQEATYVEVQDPRRADHLSSPAECIHNDVLVPRDEAGRELHSVAPGLGEVIQGLLAQGPGSCSPLVGDVGDQRAVVGH